MMMALEAVNTNQLQIKTSFVNTPPTTQAEETKPATDY